MTPPPSAASAGPGGVDGRDPDDPCPRCAGMLAAPCRPDRKRGWPRQSVDGTAATRVCLRAGHGRGTHSRLGGDHHQRMDLKIDGKVVASCPTWWCQHVWQSPTVPNGDHVVTAIAYSPPTIVTGQVARTVRVLNAAGDTTPPTVTLRVPASAAGVVSLQASATDNGRVVTTEIFVDDVRVATSTTAQASFPWNTTATANGPHRIRAVARDAAGNVGSKTSVVQVSNAKGLPQGFPNEHDGKSRWWPTGDGPAIVLRTPGLTLDERLAHVYYDQIRVMYQLADYTEDPSWNACAALAATVYRDLYVLPNGGGSRATGTSRPACARISSAPDIRRPGRRSSSCPDPRPIRRLHPAGVDPGYRAESRSRLRDASYINAQALGEPARPLGGAPRGPGLWPLGSVVRPVHVAGSPAAVLPVHGGVDRPQSDSGLGARHTIARCLVPALRRAADWLWATRLGSRGRGDGV